MAKKSFFWGMLGMVLALSFAVSGCDTGTNDTPEPEKEEVLTDETDKTALATVISNAENALAAAVVNDAADPSTVWDTVTAYISASDKIAYQTAVVAAQTVNDNATATQTEIDNAVSTLSTDIDGKIKAGTKIGIIGDTGPAGGKIFYIDATDTYPGWKYLEAAPANLAGTYAWASSAYTSTDISGTATVIGSGVANTALILATLGANAPAAKACADYVYGSYDDWFLPSKDELIAMYNVRTTIGLANVWYWSSSQKADSDSDVCVNHAETTFNKYNTLEVRAVRAF